MWTLFIIIVLFFAIAVHCTDQLELNARATMFNDVKSIAHNATLRQVVIELASHRRCNTPTFRVRLSGTSLYVLDLIMRNTVELGHNQHSPVEFKDFEKPRPGTYVFSYPPLYDLGTYFLEVMVVYCVEMRPNDFYSLCAEDVQEGRNILTLPYKFEVLANKTSAITSVARYPRWLLHKELRSSSQAALLSTRYQRKGCGGYCRATPTELIPFNQYDWADGPEYHHLLTKIFQNSSMQPSVLDKSSKNMKKIEANNDVVNFCFVGASHSKELKNHANQLNLKNFIFLAYYSQYPVQFKPQDLIDMECSYVVIGYGQWMAGLSGIPYQARQYENELKRVVTEVKQLQRTTNMQVFFRSMNCNGYGARVTACPPLDHRLPPVVDLYNSILRNVSHHAQVEYIDTNHIMGPMWDSAIDFQHPKGRVYTAEVHWILHTVLNYSVATNRFPALFPCLALAEHDLVRFEGNNATYLHKQNKLHPFPSGYNYTGLRLENIKVLAIHKQKCATFGPIITGPKDY